jgi:hypothetical protein
VKDRYDLVKDSAFYDANGRYGHPQSNFEELFASCLHAYYCHPDSFADKIKSADDETALLGRLIWLYLRDNTFNGVVFTTADPFGQATLTETMGTTAIDTILTGYKLFDAKCRGTHRCLPADLIREARRLYSLKSTGHKCYAAKTLQD